MITISVTNEAVTEALRRLRDGLDDLTPVMAGIGMELESRISDRFERQVDPLGGAWTTWAPATLAAYPASGNRKLLDRTGDMLGSLNHQVSPDSVTIGFGQPYAAYHEFGTRHMPRRGLLFADPAAGVLSPDDEAAVLAIVTTYLGSLLP